MRHTILPLLLSCFFCTASLAQEASDNPKPFGLWLKEFKQEARGQGIPASLLDKAFADAEPDERVVELDRKQPESTLTLNEYLGGAVTAKRVQKGRQLYAENRTLLKKIGAQYGVQPRFIVALWGIETSYGANMGGFDTINALTTLAYDGRRSDYFRSELIQALKILQSERMDPAEMQGSWAGALGQCQFMPTSFMQHAVDHNKDGHRDIWNSLPDVFASIANYLKSSGWNESEGWGRRVLLPATFKKEIAVITVEKPLSEWRKLGVRYHGGELLPAKETPVSLIFVGEGEEAVPYIVSSNYKVLLKWNRSRYFATAVGTLADTLGK